MIFVDNRDSTLSVYEDIEGVQRDYEGIDVEDELVRFWDANGDPLEPSFVRPNLRSGFLVSSGQYTLVPSFEPRSTLQDILRLDEEEGFVYLNDNPFFATLADVAAYVGLPRPERPRGV